MIASRIAAAWRGRSHWLMLRQKYRVDDGLYVLAFPEDNAELNDLALRHVDDLVRDRGARGVLILTDQASVAEAGRRAAEYVELVPTRLLDDLVSFYELAEFSPRFVIIGLGVPADRRVGRLIGKNGITLEDVVCLALLSLRSWAGG